MVDYAAIADRATQILGVADPDRYQEAYDVMVLEEDLVEKEEAFYSELTLMSELGVTEADIILSKIESALANPRITRMIQSAKGINLVDPQTKAMLTALLGNTVLSQDEYNRIMALTMQSIATWPNLGAGHVQNALQKRVAGEV